MKWLTVILMAFLLVACEKEGPLERAGEEIDEFVEDVRAGEETTGNKIDDALDDAKKKVNDAVDKVDPD